MSTGDDQTKKQDSVYVRTFSAQLEKCAICNEPLQGPCIGCLYRGPVEGKYECTMVFGTCSHPFHQHCMGHWLKTNSTCPIDMSVWEYAG
ncbi:MAG: hypothetical protein EZS28_041545 [Streblomastix strix]|uniref:RING-type domain-containing protein n=1 Tax=Streblomastix strix TaxID=222440 RepID=A0A5J4TXV1_9EUKA|nr:MAG: hypothetical protein EZS28_041545 [Streblomastix strix]